MNRRGEIVVGVAIIVSMGVIWLLQRHSADREAGVDESAPAGYTAPAKK